MIFVRWSVNKILSRRPFRALTRLTSFKRAPNSRGNSWITVFFNPISSGRVKACSWRIRLYPIMALVFKQWELLCLFSSASCSIHRQNYVTTSPVLIGYFWNYSLHKQGYLPANHKRILEVFFIQNPWGVLPYMAYTRMCRWTGYGFCPSLS